MYMYELHPLSVYVYVCLCICMCVCVHVYAYDLALTFISFQRWLVPRSQMLRSTIRMCVYVYMQSRECASQLMFGRMSREVAVSNNQAATIRLDNHRRIAIFSVLPRSYVNAKTR